MNKGVIQLCCWLHIYWGAILLFSNQPLNITSINSMTRVWFLQNHIIAAIMCLAFGIIALIGITKKYDRTLVGLYLALPQQFILMESLIGAIGAVASSSFADGVIRSRAFIATDQGVYIFLAIWHTIALLDLHFWEVFKYWRWQWKK